MEPVSLGNYCIIIVAFLCATFERIGWLARGFLIVGTLVLLVGCDGRLASISSAIIIVAAGIATRLPSRSALIYLPAAVAGALVGSQVLGFEPGSDDFSGRIAYTFALLGAFDVSELLGVPQEADLTQAFDSGISYLILTQSVLGLIFAWIFIVFASAENNKTQVRFTHALCIYLSLTMMVSYSFFSIKTAALLWFIHGSFQRVEMLPPLHALFLRKAFFLKGTH